MNDTDSRCAISLIDSADSSLVKHDVDTPNLEFLVSFPFIVTRGRRSSREGRRKFLSQPTILLGLIQPVHLEISLCMDAVSHMF